MARTVTTESAGGPAPDRVLVLGSGLFPPDAHPTLGGRIVADRLAAMTERGVDATVVPWSLRSGERLAAAVEGLHCDTYDVAIIAIPAADLRGRRDSSVVVDLAEALVAFPDRFHPGTRFVLIVARDGDQRHVAAAIRASHERIVAIAVDEDPDAGLQRALEATRTALDEQHAGPDSPQRHRAGPQPQEERFDAVAGLGILDTGTERRFDEITDAMARLFHTRGAAITFIPEGRQWSKSSRWFPSGDGALEDSFCQTTVLGAGPLVVGDAWEHSDVLPRNDIRFYAGYPIDTVDGVRVGAVCVFDPVPREERTVELELLREYAVLVRSRLYAG